MTGKTMTSVILSQTGKAEFNLQEKQFYLSEIKWFKAYLERNPQHSEQTWRVIETLHKIYQSIK